MRTKNSNNVGKVSFPAARLGLRQNEDGSLTIFSLFLFILILFISGMAIDLMRYESERVGVQNTIDTAIVAASSLTQEADTDEEVTALVKNYFEKAGFDPDMVTVIPDIQIPEGGTVATSRTVSASVDFNMDTMFMNMMGIDSLKGYVGGGAAEGQQLIEIALVLDISGSMGWGTKLQNMKDAAKEFVTTVINNNTADRVLISIIPYNQQVHMTPDLMARLNLENTLVDVVNPPSHPGAITQYNTRNGAARCARFYDDDFTTRRLASANDIAVSASFARGNWSYGQPDESGFWCGTDHFPAMMLYQNNETALHNHIDSFSAQGWTAIDYGMNWAVGILDPSFAPVVQGMVDDTFAAGSTVNLAPATAAGHPVAYATSDVLKYIILMTDGANTEHRDLKDPFKEGPSPIWWSEVEANGNEFDGYLVEMPDNTPDRRWYKPGSPWSTADDAYVAALPTDAVQRSYHEIYRRFSTRNVAQFFFQNSDDADAYAQHDNAELDTGGYATADVNLKAICDKAKENNWIEVFTVAFEAPEVGETVLRDCASIPGNYFDVAGTQISAAFSSIAAQISQLRLTE